LGAHAEGAPTRLRGSSGGQATAELALVLPVVVLVILLVVQVGQVVRHQVLVVHVAREVARAAAVSPVPPDAAEVAERSGLDPARLGITVDPPDAGGYVAAQVSYRVPTDVALVGVLVPEVTLGAEAYMLAEWGP